MQDTVKKLIDELKKSVELEYTINIRTFCLADTGDDDPMTYELRSEVPQRVEYDEETSKLFIQLEGDNFVEYKLDMFQVEYEDDFEIYEAISFFLSRPDRVITIDRLLTAEELLLQE